MIRPDDGGLMKWLGGGEGGGDAASQAARAAQGRSQDDAAVGYVFQRTPQEPEFPPPVPKQRWALADDTAIENQDKWKYPAPVMQQIPATQLKSAQPGQQQLMNTVIASSGGALTSLNPSIIGTHPAHLSTNLVHTQLAPGLQNHNMGNNNLVTMQSIQNNTMMLPPLQGLQNHQQGMYDMHQHPSNPMQAMNGVGKSAEHLMYLSQVGMLAPGTNQYLQQNQNQLGLAPMTAIRNQIAPAAKKLWDKGPGAGGDSKGPPHLTPLQLNHEQMWRDPTWSAQVEHGMGAAMMGARRGGGVPFPGGDVGSILSPRDSAGLGVKMVEYVLGGSPTVWSGAEGVSGAGASGGGGGGAAAEKAVVAGLRGMVLEEGRHEDGGKAPSPFDKDLHELHDHHQALQQHPHALPNGLHNGQDDDKAFNRTPGSRQPSPAEEEAAAGCGGGVGGVVAMRNGPGGAAGAGVSGMAGDPAASFPLLPPHPHPAAPLHHLPHLSHHQPHPGMLGVAAGLPAAQLQGLQHHQHPQIHPGMALNDSMNQHIELVLQMDQHPQFDSNSFASTQQNYGGGGVGGVGGAGGSGVGGGGGSSLVNGASVVQADGQQHHQSFDVQVTSVY